MKYLNKFENYTGFDHYIKKKFSLDDIHNIQDIFLSLNDKGFAVEINTFVGKSYKSTGKTNELDIKINIFKSYSTNNVLPSFNISEIEDNLTFSIRYLIDNMNYKIDNIYAYYGSTIDDAYEVSITLDENMNLVADIDLYDIKIHEIYIDLVK